MYSVYRYSVSMFALPEAAFGHWTKNPPWVKPEGMAGFVTSNTSAFSRCATKEKCRYSIALLHCWDGHSIYLVLGSFPAGSQGHLHSFGLNGLCEPMQSIWAHLLIYCQGVPCTVAHSMLLFLSQFNAKIMHLVRSGEKMRKETITD